MGCCGTIFKIILFLANVWFAFAAIALAAAGVAALLSLKDEGLDGHEARVACAVVIAVGCVAFVIAFLGCCDTVMDFRATSITIIRMVLLVTVAVLMFTTTGPLQEVVKQYLERMFKNRNLNDVFPKIEQRLECCGLEGFQSYGYMPQPSCCAHFGYRSCPWSVAYPRGCVAVAEELVRTYTVAIGSVCLVAVAAELLAMAFGLCLASRAKSRF